MVLSRTSHLYIHASRIALVTLFCCSTASAWSQTSQTALAGVIRDPERYIVPDVIVVAVDERTGQRHEVTAAPFGHYLLCDIPPGHYTVTIEPPRPEPKWWAELGYNRMGFRQTGFEVMEGYVNALDIHLGVVSEERLTIEGASSKESGLALPDGSIGKVFSGQIVETTPLLGGRTLQSVLALVPGIVITESVGTLAQFTAAGQRRFANRMTIDGINADLAVDVVGPGIDESGSGTLPAFATSGGTQTLVPFGAIEEIQVRTTNGSSEYAQTPGAQTSIVTRAGTDQLKASALFDARPHSLSAADYFPTFSESNRRFSSRSNGASLGGPLWRGRLFAFGSWESQHIDRPYEATIPVPSELSRESVPEELSPILDAFPLSNGRELGSGLAEYSNRFPVSSNLDVLSLRADVNLWTRHRLFVRVNGGRSGGDAVQALRHLPYLSFEHTESTSTKTGTIGLTSTLSSTLVNDLRLNGSVHRGSVVAGPASDSGQALLLLSDLVPTGIPNPWLRLNVFPGPFGNLLAGQTGAGSQKQFQVANTLTYVRGRHDMRFGLDVARVLAKVPAANRYTYSFTNIPQLLQGRARQVLIEEYAAARVLFRSWAVFAQDTYRPAPRLTFNLGLRYNVSPAPSSRTGIEPSVIEFETLPNLIARQTGTHLWNTSWRNLAPRAGVSYQLGTTTGRETTLRAGWDIAYDELTSPGGSVFGRGVPYVSRRLMTFVTLPVPAENLVASPASENLAEYYSFPQSLRTPRTYRWHAGIDQALKGGQRFSIAYVGAAARDLPYWYAYSAGNSQAPTVHAYSNEGRSDYHALFAEHTRRLSRGLQTSITYTWSHAIDLDSGETSAPQVPPAVFSPILNRGSADFDRRHVLRAAVSYRLPAPRAPAPIRTLLKDWQIDAVVSARAGAPVTVTVIRDLGFGFYRVRPDVVPDVPMWIADTESPNGQKINAAAFQIPTEVRQGTLGRNTLRASSLRQVDLSLSRSLNVVARLVAQVRLEAFNVFNIPNFGPPVASLTTENFGTPAESYADALGTGTLAAGGLVSLQQPGGPRSLQLGVRLTW